MEYLATKIEIFRMSKKELRNYLENDRGTAVYPDHSINDLRDMAMEELPYFKKINGRWLKPINHISLTGIYAGQTLCGKFNPERDRKAHMGDWIENKKILKCKECLRIYNKA